ncbi:MAG: glycosyl transferase [Bacteroidaceae bacterium]|nr:glycosyl transferase [Bacteroidaceae bacterium]
MMYFCTLFDSNYISKGIALYLSIENHTKDFIMYVMAMDRKCQDILKSIGFERVVVDCIEDISDPDLAVAKANRSRAEFCWTCGSYTTDFFLHQYELPDITYLDSDLMFFSSPQVVFDELKKKNASVGLAPHFTHNSLFGRYCVQYVYFRNDEDGRGCLRWWRNECLKWCYSKLEDGKYGDQKYLDYFAKRFNYVYAIENRGVGIAAWNMYYYKYKEKKVCYGNHEWPFVFFHYSNFKIDVENNKLFIRPTIYINKTIKELFVIPYSYLLKSVFNDYLSTDIASVVIEPMEKNKYVVKAATYYIKKVVPIYRLGQLYLRIKYRERKSPYSEK